jgi:multidrug resistance protein, MATE family
MSGYRAEIGAQLRLATPVVIASVGMMTMGLVDTWFVGHIPGEGTKVALAAAVLGNTMFYGAASFGMGVLNVLDPLLAQARGAGDARGFSLAMQRGGLLALALALVLAVPLAFVPLWLRLLGQDPDVIPLASGYARVVALGLPLFFLFYVLRQSLQTLGKLRPVVITVFLANGVNAFLDWIWIHGALGFPAYGVIGSAWASNVARLFMLAMLVWLAWPLVAPKVRPVSRDALFVGPFLRMLRVGVPIGFQNTLEYAAFAVVAVMMGWLSVEAVGGHMVALQPAALAFMVPMGVSVAAAVRVGFNVGAGDSAAVRRSAAVSLLLASCFMVGSAGILLVFAEPIASVFTNDMEIVLVAASLLPLAAAFQLFDGVQVTALGILRGVGDTLVPMVINLLGYWAIGFPVGYLLAFRAGLGPQGLWWGLVAGLAAVAILLTWRVKRRLSGDLARLDVDRPAARAVDHGVDERAAMPPPATGGGPAGG